MNFSPSSISKSIEKVRKLVPSDVIILAAAKKRSLDEVKAVIQAGIIHIGYNYIQEALPMIDAVGSSAIWHMIGHLQRNKARLATNNFDMIETIDSLRLAQAVENHCSEIDKIMPVLIEINSGKESNKTGVLPEQALYLATEISSLGHLKLEGLMTMGPRFGDPEESRPYFRSTRILFERIAKLNLPNVNMRYLSMGMSNSYQIAIEEGSNLIRLGTILFCDRE